MTRRDNKYPDDVFSLVLGCALSVILCSILSTTLFGITYLSLAILPAFIGILYGNYRSGLGLASLFLFCNLIFSGAAGINQFLLNSGILVFPLLFGMSAQFKKSTVIEKIGMLWMALFPSMIFVEIVPLLEDKGLFESQSSKSLLITLYLLVTFAVGGVLIYLIETIWGRLQMKGQLEGLSRRFQWESDKLQQITNVVPLSIMSLDENGNVAGINDKMLEVIQKCIPGLTKNDLLDRHVSEFIHIIEDQQIRNRLRDSIFYKQQALVKVISHTWAYHVYTSPLMHRGTDYPEGMLVVVQDMTKEENMRNELDNVERLTLVGQMAAGITHEIRNPMAVVRGFLQLMREKSPDDLQSYYHIVMEELDRANSIINDFLSLAQSRISIKEKVLLQDIIEELSPLLWADANLRGQSVELNLCPTLPMLQLNVREMKQLILNLGRNGMEAMGSKGVLTVETRKTPERVELIIKDTGSGISEIEREKLFVPFFTTKSQGTGLGLSLCLNIVERHDGKITVQSQEGIGTEFIVSFPYELNDASKLAIAE